MENNTIFVGRNSPIPVQLYTPNGEPYSAAQVEAITNILVKVNHIDVDYLSNTSFFDLTTYASEGVILIDLGLVDGMPVQRDRRVEIIVFDPFSPERGRVVELLDLFVDDGAESTGSPADLMDSSGVLVLKERTENPEPLSGYGKYFRKIDGKLYEIDSEGNVAEVGSGASGTANYSATEFTDQTSVVVTHNWGKIPQVQIIDSNGFLIAADSIQHNLNTKNSFTVSFSQIYSGIIIAMA